MEKVLADNKSYLRVIYLISVLIPLVVAFLIFFPQKLSFAGDWVKVLPTIHAGINSFTALVLIAAFIAIKQGNIQLHRSLMLMALLLGILFLVSYILYHSSVESVRYGDLNYDGQLSDSEIVAAGNGRLVYLGILASHILLSILVVPFVLLAFYYALSGRIAKHKKLVKFTYPIWLYVSVTGVIVYFMIRPYYF